MFKLASGFLIASLVWVNHSAAQELLPPPKEALPKQEILPPPRAIGIIPQPYKLELPPELKGYNTVETAIKTKVAASSSNQTQTGLTGFLGLAVERKGDRLVVESVQLGSPAERVKIQAGDVVVAIENHPVSTPDAFREFLKIQSPGEQVNLQLMREGRNLGVQATLAATSRPMQADAPQPVLGIRINDSLDSNGVLIEQVFEGSSAEKSGLKANDVILKFDGVPLPNPQKYQEVMIGKKPMETAVLVVKRGEKELPFLVSVEASNRGGPGGGFGRGNRGGGWNDRIARYYTKPIFRLAIVGVEYPDVKHNDKVKLDDWKQSFFSFDTYKTTNATGQKTYGSVNDYYQEQSYGKLRVEGKVFDWVQLPKKRAEYGGTVNVNAKTAYLKEATDKLIAREGKDALKDFDGIYFIYAGDMATTNRGDLYWPHKANFTYEGKTWQYFIVNEISGQGRMTNISVMCHEFGHMLGLPDLYARPEQPGSEGLGTWCAMSMQLRSGRPQHFSAWCKEKLDWIQPAIIDPTVKQKLVLAPIEDDPKQCFKVLVRPDGSEYYLLENRKKKGFDSDLSAEGLLIWRVVNNRPILEESHGVLGPSGPNVFLGMVPFPSPSNNSFTPYTQPSSKSQLGGGFPVHITNITRHANGLISFWTGYEFE